MGKAEQINLRVFKQGWRRRWKVAIVHPEVDIFGNGTDVVGHFWTRRSALTHGMNHVQALSALAGATALVEIRNELHNTNGVVDLIDNRLSEMIRNQALR